MRICIFGLPTSPQSFGSHNFAQSKQDEDPLRTPRFGKERVEEQDKNGGREGGGQEKALSIRPAHGKVKEECTHDASAGQDTVMTLSGRVRSGQVMSCLRAAAAHFLPIRHVNPTKHIHISTNPKSPHSSPLRFLWQWTIGSKASSDPQACTLYRISIALLIQSRTAPHHVPASAKPSQVNPKHNTIRYDDCMNEQLAIRNSSGTPISRQSRVDC